MPTAPSYDVVIVGGRPAGASLAARLGEAGLRVLVVDRDTFPSRPAVSCPLFFSSGMQLLDEIGLDEAAYADPNARTSGVSLEFAHHFRTFLSMPDLHGRDYMYGLDRARFDTALWEHLDRYPTVEKRENFAITNLCFDENGRVSGVMGRYPKQPEEQIKAGCVVGADGRFSLVARKAEAEVTEEDTAVNTTVYYAYWQNVEPYVVDGQEWIQIHTGVDGFSFILIPASEGLYGVLAQCRQDYFEAPDGPAAWYHETLRRYPYVWQRLVEAKQVTDISGMKNVPNLYREAAGDGWALVGDAYHQKDSYDGQGIYDALLEAKLLAESLIAWHSGGQSWEEAMADYRQQAYEKTHPMFEATLERLNRELYSEPPDFIVNTVLRWMLTDPTYKARFAQLVTRDIPADRWATPPVMMKALLGGLGRDLVRFITRGSNPDDMPPPGTT